MSRRKEHGVGFEEEDEFGFLGAWTHERGFAGSHFGSSPRLGFRKKHGPKMQMLSMNHVLHPGK